MNTLSFIRYSFLWFISIRPKTLIIAISPVLIGGMFAKTIDIPIFFLTIAFACLIQIGTNLVNDYFDYIKGTDTLLRKGPTRIIHTSLVDPHAVRRAYIICYSLAFVIGLYMLPQGGTLLFITMILSILFGYLYTAGPYPIGYTGLSEVFILLFFGPISSFGAYYLQEQQISFLPLVMGLPSGLIATAVLCANNLRDYSEDLQANKKTLVVRFGRTFGKIEYFLCIFSAIAIPYYLYLRQLLPNTFRYFPILLVSASLLFFRLFRDNTHLKLLSKTALFMVLYTTITVMMLL